MEKPALDYEVREESLPAAERRPFCEGPGICLMVVVLVCLAAGFLAGIAVAR